MRVRHLERASALPADIWNSFFPDDYPFTRHEFLAALEDHACVTPELGWLPHHALIEDDDGLTGIVPLYAKGHSYGEFVFDFAWADAANRVGIEYYPKLLTAVPFTPCSGPRFGVRSEHDRGTVAQAMIGLARSTGLSSYHTLFVDDHDLAAMTAAGAIERNDVQFHWYNAGYADFAAFVATFTSEKRKKILRERRRVAETELRFEVRPGDTLSEAEWLRVYKLYANTYAERGQSPYLTRGFFLDYGLKAGTPVRLILAYEDAVMVAVAITLLGGDTLYGRHWGAADHYNGLHFETCYYQGIDYCIREGLRHFDAGAQGEHKLARGFTPHVTRSAHWLADPRLHEAVDHAMTRERGYVEMREALLEAHSPYKRSTAAAEPEGLA